MNLTLWILSGFVAAVFAGAGLTKVITPRQKLLEPMPWVEDASDQQVKAIGALEVAGAVGLILPAALGILPVLVPLAAVGLAATMVGAIVVHVRRGEALAHAVPAVVLLVLCLVIAWGRFGPYAF